jgi:hypothetical protein
MVKSAQVTVTTTAAKLEDEGQEMAGDTVFIRNTDAAISVFLGGSGVTNTTGFELKAGQQIGPLAFDSADAPLYAVAASGTPRVDVLAV